MHSYAPVAMSGPGSHACHNLSLQAGASGPSWGGGGESAGGCESTPPACVTCSRFTHARRTNQTETASVLEGGEAAHPGGLNVTPHNIDPPLVVGSLCGFCQGNDVGVELSVCE